MLDKRTRAKIIAQKFYDKGEEKNPSQFFDRVRKQSGSMLRDLTLITSNMPDKEQAEAINAQNLEPFIKALLHLQRDKGDLMLSDQRRTLLASTLADISLQYCTFLYHIIETDEVFAKANIELFDRVRDLVRRLPARAQAPPRKGILVRTFEKELRVISKPPEGKKRARKP